MRQREFSASRPDRRFLPEGGLCTAGENSGTGWPTIHPGITGQFADPGGIAGTVSVK